MKITENKYLQGNIKKIQKEIDKWVNGSTSIDIEMRENDLEAITREFPLNQLEEFISLYENTQNPTEKDRLIQTIYPHAAALNKVFYDYYNEGRGDKDYADTSGAVLRIISPSWGSNPTKMGNGTIIWHGGTTLDKENKEEHKDKADDV